MTSNFSRIYGTADVRQQQSTAKALSPGDQTDEHLNDLTLQDTTLTVTHSLGRIPDQVWTQVTGATIGNVVVTESTATSVTFTGSTAGLTFNAWLQ